jgi:2-methylcitrate dehydratase PrpD
VLRGAVRVDDIERVDLQTFEAAARYPGCDDPGPIDVLPAARMSLQYAVASVLARGELTEANFTDIDNPALRALVPKVRVEIVDRFTAAYPARQGARVVVRTRDGSALEGSVDEVPSFGFDEIVGRYRRVASALLDAAHVEALEQTSLRCSELAYMRDLIDRLTKNDGGGDHARAPAKGPTPVGIANV